MDGARGAALVCATGAAVAGAAGAASGYMGALWALGRAVQVDPMEPVLKPPGLCS